MLFAEKHQTQQTNKKTRCSSQLKLQIYTVK